MSALIWVTESYGGNHDDGGGKIVSTKITKLCEKKLILVGIDGLLRFDRSLHRNLVAIRRFLPVPS